MRSHNSTSWWYKDTRTDGSSEDDKKYFQSQSKEHIRPRASLSIILLQKTGRSKTWFFEWAPGLADQSDPGWNDFRPIKFRYKYSSPVRERWLINKSKPLLEGAEYEARLQFWDTCGLAHWTEEIGSIHRGLKDYGTQTCNTFPGAYFKTFKSEHYQASLPAYQRQAQPFPKWGWTAEWAESWVLLVPELTSKAGTRVWPPARCEAWTLAGSCLESGGTHGKWPKNNRSPGLASLAALLNNSYPTDIKTIVNFKELTKTNLTWPYVVSRLPSKVA